MLYQPVFHPVPSPATLCPPCWPWTDGWGAGPSHPLPNTAAAGSHQRRQSQSSLPQTLPVSTQTTSPHRLSGMSTSQPPSLSEPPLILPDWLIASKPRCHCGAPSLSAWTHSLSGPVQPPGFKYCRALMSLMFTALAGCHRLPYPAQVSHFLFQLSPWVSDSISNVLSQILSLPHPRLHIPFKTCSAWSLPVSAMNTPSAHWLCPETLELAFSTLFPHSRFNVPKSSRLSSESDHFSPPLLPLGRKHFHSAESCVNRLNCPRCVGN